VKTVKMPLIINTRRLVLRKPRLSDAPMIFKTYACDPKVTKYVTFKPHKSLKETKSFVKRTIAEYKLKRFTFAVESRETGELMGNFAFRIDRFKAEIGYVLAAKYWGKGYATEAARAVICQLFKNSGIFRVWAVCDTGNKASARVLIKAGMRLEGKLKRWMIHPNRSKSPRDCFCYAITRN